MAEGTRASRLVAEVVALALLSFCLVVLLTNILPTRRHLAEIRRDASRLRQEILREERERDRLEKYARALASDPATQRREYQRAFRIYGEGETVIRFPGEEPDVGR